MNLLYVHGTNCAYRILSSYIMNAIIIVSYNIPFHNLSILHLTMYGSNISREYTLFKVDNVNFGLCHTSSGFHLRNYFEAEVMCTKN